MTHLVSHDSQWQKLMCDCTVNLFSDFWQICCQLQLELSVSHKYLTADWHNLRRLAGFKPYYYHSANLNVKTRLILTILTITTNPYHQKMYCQHISMFSSCQENLLRISSRAAGCQLPVDSVDRKKNTVFIVCASFSHFCTVNIRENSSRKLGVNLCKGKSS